MPILTLYFKENILESYPLEKGQSLTIGRKGNNDISIENLAVSGHHAKIDAEGGGFILTDLQSKNGSFVNNKPVSTHWLQHGDSITIGKHHLIFTYGDEEERPKGLFQETAMDTDKPQDMLDQAISQLAVPKDDEKQRVGILSYVSGGEGEIRLTKKITKFGKRSSSDIVLGGFLMGQTAAAISRAPKGYSLIYVGGMTKPKVNGEVVKDSVNLKEFDIIELGSARFKFVTEK
ncbi:MAG: FHA domain-containing protein [Desulfobacterales bacterium]|nr:MAG: FHA domain-containing protein [Desulfobacterales bacterium]